jgi:hypothetical protein
VVVICLSNKKKYIQYYIFYSFTLLFWLFVLGFYANYIDLTRLINDVGSDESFRIALFGGMLGIVCYMYGIDCLKLIRWAFNFGKRGILEDAVVPAKKDEIKL